MTARRSFLRSFAAGEISPLLHGRPDLVPYQTGLALCRNFVTMPQGPAKYRPGFVFAQYGADSVGRLLSFVYSDDQAYAIEFAGNGLLRIHTLWGTLLSDTGDVTIEAITLADPCVISFAQGKLFDGDDVYLDDCGVTELDGRWYRLKYLSNDGTDDFFALGTPTLPDGIDATGYQTYTPTAPVASVPLQLAHPYSDDELPQLRYTQSADVLTVVHPNHPVMALRRSGPNTWTFTGETFGPEAPAPASLTATPGGGSAGTASTHYYVVTNVVTDGSANAESLAYGPASASQDLTVTGQYVDLAATAPPAGTRNNYYKALNGLYGFIGQGGATFRDQNIIPDLSISPPEYGEDFNASGDYPRAVGYHEQRKVFGGTVNKPQTIWMTRNGTEVDMTYTVPSRDDNALAFGLASRDLQTIQHLVSLRDLLVLTSGGVWRISSSNGNVLTPASVNARPSSYIGANHVQPAVVDNAVLYAFARGGRVGEIKYSDGDADYTVSDISLLAPHLFDGYTIVDMVLMETPTRILWVLRSDGALLSLTYQPEHKVLAWHAHDLGGAVRSICLLPDVGNAATSEDVLFVFVERKNGNAGYTAIERLTGFGDYPEHWRDDYWDQDDNLAKSRAVHVDSALIYEGAPADRFVGLFHLEGREVSIVADGAVHPALTVVNGEVTLESTVERVVIGLPYIGRLQTLPLALEQIEADGRGLGKAVSKVHLNLLQSSGVHVGPSFDALVEMKARTVEPYGIAPAWRTGEFEVTIDPLWSRSGAVCIEQRDPMPLTLLSMVIEAEVAVGGRA